MKLLNGDISELNANEIFVFGSNTQGRHGKGSALVAKKLFGAKYGQSHGLQGQSYAICTKDISSYPYKQIPREDIVFQIKTLYQFAISHKDLKFYIVYKGYGTNLNGYTPNELATMFSMPDIPKNIIFHKSFKNLL